MNDECEWLQEDGEECYYWETSCGTSFMFESDGPKENGFNFCHKCGSKLVLAKEVE